jgi:hypothetical protein
MLNVTEGQKSLLRFAGRTFVDRTDVVGQGLREKPTVKAGTLVLVLAANCGLRSRLSRPHSGRIALLEGPAQAAYEGVAGRILSHRFPPRVLQLPDPLLPFRHGEGVSRMAPHAASGGKLTNLTSVARPLLMDGFFIDDCIQPEDNRDD